MILFQKALDREHEESEAFINIQSQLANVYFEAQMWTNTKDLYTDCIKKMIKLGISEKDNAIIEVKKSYGQATHIQRCLSKLQIVSGI